jgi:hypothetical protein
MSSVLTIRYDTYEGTSGADREAGVNRTIGSRWAAI